ncbi:MAG: DUF4026 domain-containing protein [Alysiella sp.]|uniref:DUF4026 domain-containing protein n=1 Tax=Alysiella sp. TaxID=1872483 RepID=UPI0026DD802E|nr:DUF4026 domain-containing protein [Alysiella sp.]MDO4434434.1 DUF4026 domain-containing protein [Alysiella sp.]
MYNPSLPIYDDLKNGAYQAPSIYLAALKNHITKPTVDMVRERVQKVLQRADVSDVVLVEETEDGEIRIVLSSQDDDEDEPTFFMFSVKFLANENPEEWSDEAAAFRDRNLLADERMEMHQATQLLECLTYLDSDWGQTNWLLQLAVIDAVAGECYAVQDLVASTFLSGTWLAEMAQTHTPPSLECAYVIHAITPEDAENGDYWLHTHGLLKFGLPELEILCVKQPHLSVGQNIITSMANILLYNGTLWHEDEAFTLARHEHGELAIRMMSWQDALTHDLFDPQKVGAFSGDLNDRPEGDIHTEPSMVLLADVDGKMTHFADLGDILHEDNHMMFMLPNQETARMYYQAAEKLPILAQCMKRFAPEQGVWGYMMKIACHSPSTEETEHMWFVVEKMDDENVTAKLVNDPFAIPEMHSGNTYTLPLADVSDWCIYSSPLKARIAPDDVFRLRRYLNAN